MLFTFQLELLICNNKKVEKVNPEYVKLFDKIYIICHQTIIRNLMTPYSLKLVHTNIHILTAKNINHPFGFAIVG